MHIIPSSIFYIRIDPLLWISPPSPQHLATAHQDCVLLAKRKTLIEEFFKYIFKWTSGVFKDTGFIFHVRLPVSWTQWYLNYADQEFYTIDGSNFICLKGFRTHLYQWLTPTASRIDGEGLKEWGKVNEYYIRIIPQVLNIELSFEDNLTLMNKDWVRESYKKIVQ